MKHPNIHIIRVPEGGKREQGIKNLFEEIMAKNFPNLVREKDTQAWKVQSPKQINLKRPTPRHIIIKGQKVKTKTES